jgi:transcriptional regulator with XRE-family HTH domain
MTLAERIRERLSVVEMTQADLGRRAGIPQSTLNSILQRDTRSTPHLIKLAAALRTTPAYLLGETDDPESEIGDAAISFEERELVKLTRKLPREDFDALAHLVRSLARAAVARDVLGVRDEVGRTLHDRQLGYRSG